MMDNKFTFQLVAAYCYEFLFLADHMGGQQIMEPMNPAAYRVAGIHKCDGGIQLLDPPACRRAIR